MAASRSEIALSFSLSLSLTEPDSRQTPFLLKNFVCLISDDLITFTEIRPFFRRFIMRKNCNLKLQLQPHPPPQPFDLSSPHHLHQRRPTMMEDSDHHSPDYQQQQQQQLTIFYNGQVSVCHVTESQARAIIMLAGREMMMGRSPNATRAPKAKITRSDEDEERTTSSWSQVSTLSPSPSPSLSPGASPTTALSMKRSLQRFLQERRHRISATSPYNVQ